MTTPGVPPDPSPFGRETIVGRSRARGYLRFSPMVLVLGVVVGVATRSPVLVVGVILVALLALAVVARRPLRATLRWHAPELTVPAGGLALGAPVPVRYRRQPRGLRDLPEADIDLRLFCEERVTYRRGTDTVTDTTLAAEIAFQATGEGTPDGFEALVVVTIPHDRGAPTMDLPNNEIRWYLEAQAMGSTLPDDVRRFPIRVVPVLDRSLVEDGR